MPSDPAVLAEAFKKHKESYTLSDFTAPDPSFPSRPAKFLEDVFILTPPYLWPVLPAGCFFSGLDPSHPQYWQYSSSSYQPEVVVKTYYDATRVKGEPGNLDFLVLHGKDRRNVQSLANTVNQTTETRCDTKFYQRDWQAGALPFGDEHCIDHKDTKGARSNTVSWSSTDPDNHVPGVVRSAWNQTARNHLVQAQRKAGGAYAHYPIYTLTDVENDYYYANELTPSGTPTGRKKPVPWGAWFTLLSSKPYRPSATYEVPFYRLWGWDGGARHPVDIHQVPSLYAQLDKYSLKQPDPFVPAPIRLSSINRAEVAQEYDKAIAAATRGLGEELAAGAAEYDPQRMYWAQTAAELEFAALDAKVLLLDGYLREHKYTLQRLTVGTPERPANHQWQRRATHPAHPLNLLHDPLVQHWFERTVRLAEYFEGLFDGNILGGSSRSSLEDVAHVVEEVAAEAAGKFDDLKDMWRGLLGDSHCDLMTAAARQPRGCRVDRTQESPTAAAAAANSSSSSSMHNPPKTPAVAPLPLAGSSRYRLPVVRTLIMEPELEGAGLPPRPPQQTTSSSSASTVPTSPIVTAQTDSYEFTCVKGRRLDVAPSVPAGTRQVHLLQVQTGDVSKLRSRQNAWMPAHQAEAHDGSVDFFFEPDRKRFGPGIARELQAFGQARRAVNLSEHRWLKELHGVMLVDLRGYNYERHRSSFSLAAARDISVVVLLNATRPTIKWVLETQLLQEASQLRVIWTATSDTTKTSSGTATAVQEELGQRSFARCSEYDHNAAACSLEAFVKRVYDENASLPRTPSSSAHSAQPFASASPAASAAVEAAQVLSPKPACLPASTTLRGAFGALLGDSSAACHTSQTDKAHRRVKLNAVAPMGPSSTAVRPSLQRSANVHSTRSSPEPAASLLRNRLLGEHPASPRTPPPASRKIQPLTPATPAAAAVFRLGVSGAGHAPDEATGASGAGGCLGSAGRSPQSDRRRGRIRLDDEVRVDTPAPAVGQLSRPSAHIAPRSEPPSGQQGPVSSFSKSCGPVTLLPPTASSTKRASVAKTVNDMVRALLARHWLF